MALTRYDTNPRHLVLLDIENLAAAPCPTHDQLEEVKEHLRGAIEGFDDLPCVVACSHRAARVVAFAFPTALRRWRSGPDGADLALIDEIKDMRLMERYDRVTLCSGDGIFASYVAGLADAGVDTTVVALRGHLSRRLQLAARTVVELQPTVTVATSAAERRAG